MNPNFGDEIVFLGKTWIQWKYWDVLSLQDCWYRCM